jgi:subtilisin-like proprotein convertase family protein
VTFTATVTTANGDPVTVGEVTFSEGARTLGVEPVNASGAASLTTGSGTFTPGRRLVTATYNGTGFAQSSDSVDQLVVSGDSAGGDFCNSSAIRVPGSGTLGSGNPYPSPITVSGAGDVTDLVTVQLAGISHTFPDDLDVLLVGPAGANVILMSDTGQTFDLAGVTVTFADAGGPLPDAGQIVTGTYRPTNAGGADSWPTPAPVASGQTALDTFVGFDPNGTWNLFVIDDATGDTGSIDGGWCLNIDSAFVADAGGPYTIAEGDNVTFGRLGIAGRHRRNVLVGRQRRRHLR